MEALIIIGITVLFIVSYIVGGFGEKREIGFAGAFFASLFLSPILGMMFVLASDKKKIVKSKTPIVYKPEIVTEVHPVLSALEIFIIIFIIVTILGCFMAANDKTVSDSQATSMALEEDYIIGNEGNIWYHRDGSISFYSSENPKINPFNINFYSIFESADKLDKNKNITKVNTVIGTYGGYKFTFKGAYIAVDKTEGFYDNSYAGIITSIHSGLYCTKYVDFLKTIRMTINKNSL